VRENLNLGRASAFARVGVISRAREAESTRRELRANAVKYADIEDGMTALSGGNQQKVLAARVLGSAGRVVVLEDPTAGVDRNAKRQIKEAIRARAADGLSVVLVSSDLTESIALADTLLTLFAGRVMRQYDAPGPGDRSAIVADVIGHGNDSAPPNPW
jgi:ribose transport system ATP-binding protein